MDLFLAFLDQFRYMAGSLLMILIMCRRALPERERFSVRLFIGAGICLALAFCYVPLQRLLGSYTVTHPMIIGPYWVLMGFILVWFVKFCYETSWTGALFRTMIAAFTENIATALIRNLFVYTLYPDFPAEHPLGYVLIMVAFYGVFLFLSDWNLASRLRSDELAHFPEDRVTTLIYLFVYIAYNALLFATKYQMERIILPLAEYPELWTTYRYLQFFFVALLVVLSVMMTVLMWHVYRRLAVQAEKEVISRLASDRQAQYEFSRENIEMINRKSHDLKHQLQALARVTEEERQQQIQEASRAIDFYDAVVKTGNDALDTLLTEKSVYCANRNIRLSCMVNTRSLQGISLVDLYTLLGNALDNAIESVERINDPEKKVISLSILDQGGMLYIQLENYYEGELRQAEGEKLPRTRKRDQENHGYGLKSIQNIVRRYGGSMNLRAEDQVFNLEILIPAGEKSRSDR